MDSRDVVFQGDPFLTITDDAAHLYLERHVMKQVESSMFTLGHCFPLENRRHLAVWPVWRIICSGVIAGAVPPLLEILSLQTSRLAGIGDRCFEGLADGGRRVVEHMLDQITLNVVIVHTRNDTLRDKIRLIAPQRSPVLHMAGFSISCYDWLQPAVWINPWGYAPSILHQFDHHPALFFCYLAYYTITHVPWRSSLINHMSLDYLTEYTAQKRGPRDQCPMPITRNWFCGALALNPRRSRSFNPQVQCPGTQGFHAGPQRNPTPGPAGAKEEVPALAQATFPGNRTVA